MFRKNFREGAKSSGGGGGIKLQSKANRTQVKRSRDMGYGNMDADVHYRTHLFFSPNRGLNSNDCEGLCEFYVVSIVMRVSMCAYVCVPQSLSFFFFVFLFHSLSLCLIFFVFLCPSLLFNVGLTTIQYFSCVHIFNFRSATVVAKKKKKFCLINLSISVCLSRWHVEKPPLYHTHTHMYYIFVIM